MLSPIIVHYWSYVSDLSFIYRFIQICLLPPANSYKMPHGCVIVAVPAMTFSIIQKLPKYEYVFLKNQNVHFRHHRACSSFLRLPIWSIFIVLIGTGENFNIHTEDIFKFLLFTALQIIMSFFSASYILLFLSFSCILPYLYIWAV